MTPSYDELLDRDPIVIYELGINWEPSFLINGKPTEASAGARIFKLDDSTFLAFIEEHLDEALENFEDSELHLISEGLLMRLSDVKVHGQLGPFDTLDEAKKAVAAWRPSS